MYSTGIFTTHYVNIPVGKINEPIYLIPFGDVHRSSPMCHEEKWQEFLDWARSKAPKRTYFLGMGDYDDLASASERIAFASPAIHESSIKTLENLYRSHTERLAKELKFMDGRLIGLIEGNHYAILPEGITSTQLLCQKLNAKYLGVSCFTRLAFQYSTRNCSIDIWAHHGRGAARLAGGSLNKVINMVEQAEADVYLMGHDHKKSVATMTRLKLADSGARGSLSHRKILVARTGSFLKAYQDGKASYVADMNLNPADLGVVKIELTPRRDEKMGTRDQFYIDLHASI
jgi:hypothetical protein